MIRYIIGRYIRKHNFFFLFFNGGYIKLEELLDACHIRRWSNFPRKTSAIQECFFSFISKQFFFYIKPLKNCINNVNALSRIFSHVFEFFCVVPVNQLWIEFISYTAEIMFLTIWKMYVQKTCSDIGYTIMHNHNAMPIWFDRHWVS